MGTERWTIAMKKARERSPPLPLPVLRSAIHVNRSEPFAGHGSREEVSGSALKIRFLRDDELLSNQRFVVVKNRTDMAGHTTCPNFEHVFNSIPTKIGKSLKSNLSLQL